MILQYYYVKDIYAPLCGKNSCSDSKMVITLHYFIKLVMKWCGVIGKDLMIVMLE